MKFGGTSVAGAEQIKRAAGRLVAAREAGARVVAVLSARGKTTDELVAQALEISDRPVAREMDMLLSTGERISCALCAMAIHDMGHEAISLTGSQAGIVTDSSHTKARIIDVRAERIREALDDDRIVLVAGFQGVSTLSETSPRWAGAAPTRPQLRLPPRLAPASVKSIPTSLASSAPIRGLSPMPASCPCSPMRRCLRCQPRGPGCCSCARSSTRATTASESIVEAALRSRPVPSS